MRILFIFHLCILMPLLFVATGCVDEAGNPASDEEVLHAEADRRSESVDEPVEVMDDERTVAIRIRDATVAAKIRTALVEAQELRRFEFDPIVVNGRVMLRGEVNTQEQRRRAAAVAESIDGVRSVINEVAAVAEPMPDEPDAADREAMIAQMEEAAEPEEASGSTDTAADAPAQGEPDDAADAAADAAVYHTVRSGESLWTIANNNGVTIDQIRRLNNLGSSSNIKPGQRLQLK